MIASVSAALLLAMQATTAQNITDTPLEAGKWILRESIERGTGYGGISASLLSNDGRYRLTVRCDYSYQQNISIQFLPVGGDSTHATLPAYLTRVRGNSVVKLVWERAGSGVFARDGTAGVDNTASKAAAALQSMTGMLRVDALATNGQAIIAMFDSSTGHAAIKRAREYCGQA